MITRLAVDSPATAPVKSLSSTNTPKGSTKSGKTMQDMLGFHSLSPPGDHQLSSSSSTSSSSATNTDSDSLSHLSMQRTTNLAKIVETNNNNNQQQQANKSPILIKYNYYDYNGSRQEQTNQDMNWQQQQQHHHQQEKQVHRQLSPTFKQSLDQIVRQQLVATSTSSSRSSSSTSPSSSPEHLNNNNTQILHFARRYKLSQYEQRCLRCGKTVYQMDKVGPLKDFTFYHQNCFKCRECGTKLTLKTYFNNQQRSGDQEVYCHRHCPKSGPGKLDNQSVGIRCALNAPKVFEGHLTNLEREHQWTQQPMEIITGDHHSPQVDSRALYIQHAVQQTRLQNIYKQQARQVSLQQQMAPSQLMKSSSIKTSGGELEQQVDSKKLAQLISRRLEFLEPKQKLLEMRHREEEDQLFKAFELKWRQEESSISEQIKEEWQVELSKLLDKYKRQLSSISANQQQQQQEQQQQQQHQQHQQVYLAPVETLARQPPPPGSKQQMIELERLNLEKTMTIKLDRKKETLKRKLKEFERQATAELVEKQSREMLALISMKLAEYKEEQKHHQRKIGSDLEQFEAMDSLANQLGSSLQLQHPHQQPLLRHSPTAHSPGAHKGVPSLKAVSMEAPAPVAPKTSKMELYNNEEADEVFRDVDELAINVAREDQQSFTDLVHHLTRRCITDVEKCRAIFRWITVKNLNTMHFDQSVQPDTPLGLLRGIKNGSESYHVLFKRLCSYAGLHCVVIKGYSKSAGYQPGVRFEGNRFRNSWNAVYVAGAWRFVQCNWGARHLVSVAVMQDKSQTNGKQQQAVPGRSHHHHRNQQQSSPNHGRRGLAAGVLASTLTGSQSSLAAQYEASNGSSNRRAAPGEPSNGGGGRSADSLRYEYDDHYFLTDPDEFIYEFHPLQPEWQLLGTRPISLQEFEQLPFVRSLFFKYGLYFPQHDIRSVLNTDSSGATTIKIGMPTHMIPSLIFHYNLKYYDSDQEHHEGISLKRFVMQSIESGNSGDVSSPNSQGHTLLSNIVSFRVHLPQNGAYILDIFANSTTPSQYITGEPMKFKSVCKFKIVAKNLKTVMIPLPDCASGEYGPMKATRLFGIIPITHENGLIVVQNDKRFLEIQFRMTRPLLDFMASLHKNGYDERQLSKSIKIFIDGDIVIVTVKFFEDGQYGLDIYTRDHLNHHHHSSLSPTTTTSTELMTNESAPTPDNQQFTAYNEHPRKQLLTHCCKYLINVRTLNNQQQR